MLDATRTTVDKGLKETSEFVAPRAQAVYANVAPVIDATRENVGKGIEVVTPHAQAVIANVGPVLDATRENIGKTSEAVAREVAPHAQAVIDATRENVEKGLGKTSEFVAPHAQAVWEATADGPLGRGLQAANDRLQITTAFGPVIEASSAAAIELAEATMDHMEATSAAAIEAAKKSGSWNERLNDLSIGANSI